MSLAGISRERLPSGRHHLTRDLVSGSQQGRLLVAILETVGQRGWPNTRVADVVKQAGVSRQTFYELFPSLQACFENALSRGIQELIRPMDEAARANPGAMFEDLVRMMLGIYVEALVEVDGLAEAIHIELLRAGEDFLSTRAALFELCADYLGKVYTRRSKVETGMPEHDRRIYRMVFGGLDELFRERIRTMGTPAALEGLGDIAADLALDLLGIERGVSTASS